VKRAIEEAMELLRSCQVCPRRCEVNRLEDEVGFCGIGREMRVASAGPHFGEEAELVGRRGSGTIFFAGCNLGCIFCQNYELSHLREGRPVSPAEVARLMLHLESIGCHNINFVTPTHVTPQVMAAIAEAREQGLQAPIVYNCGGYESVEMLRRLEGFVEIYMPDAKYADRAAAARLSQAPDYPEVMRAALREMHRQVGDLQIEEGVATRGLLVRHLVLPNDLAGSRAIIDFLADDISPNTFVNVMAQYRPCYRAGECPEVDRPPTAEELEQARAYAHRRGLRLAD